MVVCDERLRRHLVVVAQDDFSNLALTLAILHEKLNHVYRYISTLGFSLFVSLSLATFLN